jgi:hypothetical protein
MVSFLLWSWLCTPVQCERPHSSVPMQTFTSMEACVHRLFELRSATDNPMRVFTCELRVTP